MSASERTIRLLHLTSGNLYGGIERMLVTLAVHRALCPEMEPHFGVCFDGRLSREIRAAGAAVDDLGPVHLSRPGQLWLARRRLSDLMRRFQSDLVVTHSAWAHAVFSAAATRQGVPVVRWLHAPCERGLIDRWAARTRPDVVVCNSRFTRATADALGGEAIRTIYCPVPHERPSAEAAREIRRTLDVPDETCVIAHVARMEPGKGHDTHLDALARLSHVPSWRCWFVGGAQRPSERRYVDRLRTRAVALNIEDRVTFLGERTDVAAVLSGADIYCQPGRAEGFGLTFVEALHAGLPIVTTDVGAARELVDGSCGVLVPPGDVDAVASALRELMADSARRDRLGREGRTRAHMLCDPATQLRKIAAMARMAVARRRPVHTLTSASATSSAEDAGC